MVWRRPRTQRTGLLQRRLVKRAVLLLGDDYHAAVDTALADEVSFLTDLATFHILILRADGALSFSHHLFFGP